VEQAQRLTDRGAVTGWASLHLAGANWFGGLDADGRELPVPLALSPLHELRNAPGVEVSRQMLPRSEVVLRHGVPCLGDHRSIFDVMRRVRGVRHAVRTLAMAMYAELTSPSRFGPYVLAHSGRTLVGQCRDAVGLAPEGAESPQEASMLLVWVVDAGLPRPLLNRSVYDLNGNFLARPDLLDPVAGVFGEYDGGHHHGYETRLKDVGRKDLLRRSGLEGFTVVGGELPDRKRVADRMIETRERAFRAAHPRRWTITPPDGVLALSLDERLLLREVLDAMRPEGRWETG
jgi:hypothetical protein